MVHYYVHKHPHVFPVEFLNKCSYFYILLIYLYTVYFKLYVLASEDVYHLSVTFLRYTSAAQDLVMHSRGKLFEKKWKTADAKAATVDDISVFVIPLAPYKEEYMEWKQEYEAIRGIYETSCETSELFGKLSLRTSPVATGKSVVRVLDNEDAVERGSLPDNAVDSAPVSDSLSYNSDTATNSDENISAYMPGQASSVSGTENTSSDDHLSSHYSNDISCLSTVTKQILQDSYDSVPCTESHTTPEVAAVSEPKESSQSPSTST